MVAGEYHLPSNFIMRQPVLSMADIFMRRSFFEVGRHGVYRQAWAPYYASSSLREMKTSGAGARALSIFENMIKYLLTSSADCLCAAERSCAHARRHHEYGLSRAIVS